MTTLSVAATPPAAASADLGAVLPSLSSSLVAAGPGQPADIVAVDGTGGWPERMSRAVSGGARGVLVVQPVPVPAHLVPRDFGVPVVVDHSFAGNPSVPAGAVALSECSRQALVELSATVAVPDDLEAMLVDQLATMRGLGRPVERLRLLTWGPGGYYLDAGTDQGGDAVISAHVTTSVPACVVLRALGDRISVELSLPDPSTARPGILLTSTPTGTTSTPMPWETSHRAAWRRLHAAVTGCTATPDLVDLADDLTLLAPLGRPALGPSSLVDHTPREDHHV